MWVLSHVILLTKVAFNLIKLPLLPFTETCERAFFTIFCQLQEEILQHNNKNTNVCDMGTSKLLINVMMLPV